MVTLFQEENIFLCFSVSEIFCASGFFKGVVETWQPWLRMQPLLSVAKTTQNKLLDCTLDCSKLSTLNCLKCGYIKNLPCISL